MGDEPAAVYVVVACMLLLISIPDICMIRQRRRQADRLARQQIAWDTHPTFCECVDCKEMPL